MVLAKPVLTADKGVALVVIDRKEYIDKATNLISQSMYRTIDEGPTNRLKGQTYYHPQAVEKGNRTGESHLRVHVSNRMQLPQVYGLPKIHKASTLLRPMVSSRGSVPYGIAKVLNKISNLW